MKMGREPVDGIVKKLGCCHRGARTMASLLSKLSKRPEELLRDLNYLNTGEIKSFCDKHAIPYTIVVESKDGKRRRTKDADRKGVILGRIRHYLRTGGVLKATCFHSRVVRFEAIPKKLGATDRLFYGQTSKSNRIVTKLLRKLTGGKFEDGAIARILVREYWSRGEAPTFRKYATAWLRARKEHTKPNPEWAFLSDRAEKTAGAEWKKMRARKAKKVMRLLGKLSVKPAARGAESKSQHSRSPQ